MSNFDPLFKNKPVDPLVPAMQIDRINKHEEKPEDATVLIFFTFGTLLCKLY